MIALRAAAENLPISAQMRGVESHGSGDSELDDDDGETGYTVSSTLCRRMTAIFGETYTGKVAVESGSL